jgi:tetratricopeptide (TPR) repeat protein
MFKRTDTPFRAIDFVGIGRPFSVAALCLSLASPVFAEQHSSRTTHAAPAAKEDSVLIATREATPETPLAEAAPHDIEPGTAGAQEVCEEPAPVPQSSDHSPELAPESAHDEASTSFDHVLAKAAQKKHAETSAAAKDASKNTEQEATATNGAARRSAAAHATATTFEPVKFQGIDVGNTSKHELITAWGQPAETGRSDEGEVLTFRKAPFKAIDVLIGPNDVAASVKITLAAPLESKQLAEQLGLNQFDPVTVTDDSNTPVCQAYPERGVLFMFEPAEKVTPVEEDAQPIKQGQSVAQVVVQPIDSRAFAYRAENRLQGPYAQNINDLKAAIALDPEFARAYWLLAKIYIATGQADLADAAAAEACDIEPKNASFQVCRAQTRELLGEYDDAVLGVRAILDREDLTQIDRAAALHQMAHLASLGDKEIASKTIPFETKAIEIADKLATSKDLHERRAAKQLLVEAHVAIGEEVARQPFGNKAESLSQWIGRASGLAEDYIAKDNGSVELRLYIAQHALNALASFKPALDPTPWITEAEEASKTLLLQSNDELWQQHVKWELGTAYLNGLRVEHTRRQTENALKYGQLAIDNLSFGATSRQAVHGSEQMVGTLYFQMGAVYAVHKLDHNKAVQWYDKSIPLLTSKRPASELYAPRREGEMLVSMGVSYWQVDKKDRALDVTQTGVGLVEAAVQNGVLAKSSLAVPYSNLSAMYLQMGEAANSAKYAKLAKSIDTSGDANDQPQQPRIGRTQTTSQTRQNRSR